MAGRDVHQHARARLRSNVRFKYAYVRYADRAGVHQGGHARLHADNVRLAAVKPDAGRRRAVGSVGVQIDQPRQHVPSATTNLDRMFGFTDR